MGLKVDKTMDAQGFIKHLVNKKTVKKKSLNAPKKKSLGRNLTSNYSTNQLHSKVASSLLSAMDPFEGKAWKLPHNSIIDPLP
jgi:hypothetical protein